MEVLNSNNIREITHADIEIENLKNEIKELSVRITELEKFKLQILQSLKYGWVL